MQDITARDAKKAAQEIPGGLEGEASLLAEATNESRSHGSHAEKSKQRQRRSRLGQLVLGGLGSLRLIAGSILVRGSLLVLIRRLLIGSVAAGLIRGRLACALISSARTALRSSRTGSALVR